jgi:glycosyltransferase involved in cell wall biosynthesis
MGVPVVTKIPGVTLDNAFAYLKLPLSSWDAREAIGHLGLQPIYASLTWLDLRNSTRLVFDSNHSMRSAERYYRIRFRDRSNVARNFVSIDQTKDVNNTPTNQIIFVGRLIALKGVLDLIIAFSILSGKPEFAKWKLLLIGDGPLRAKVEHKIDQLDLRRNVYVLGQVDFSEVLRRERESHLLVHPSYVESNSVALAEAMAIGLPVVVPYEPWAVEQTQNYHSKAYFTLGDASDMARAIEAATKMRVQTSLPQAKGDKGHLLNEILSEAVREMTIKLAR